MMPDRINVKSEPLKWNPHGTARPSTLRIFKKQRSHLWLRYKKALCYNVGTEGTGPAMPSPAVISWESHLMFFGFRAFFPGKYKGRIQRRDRLRWVPKFFSCSDSFAVCQFWKTLLASLGSRFPWNASAQSLDSWMQRCICKRHSLQIVQQQSTTSSEDDTKQKPAAADAQGTTRKVWHSSPRPWTLCHHSD